MKLFIAVLYICNDYENIQCTNALMKSSVLIPKSIIKKFHAIDWDQMEPYKKLTLTKDLMI